MPTRIIQLDKGKNGTRARVGGYRLEPQTRPTAEQAVGALVLDNRDFFALRVSSKNEPSQDYDDNEIELGFNALSDRVEQELRNRARKILRENSDLREFIKGMGGTTFVDSSDDQINMEDDPRFEPVAELLRKWDEVFHLSGIPVRFTATGPEVTDWGCKGM